MNVFRCSPRTLPTSPMGVFRVQIFVQNGIIAIYSMLFLPHTYILNASLSKLSCNLTSYL